jgi:hypothetical protein
MNFTIGELQQIFTESQKINVETAIKRDSYFQPLLQAAQEPVIKAITGFRRVGKSFLLKKLSRHLQQEQGIKQENIFFVNFEMDRLADIEDVKALRNLFDFYKANIAQPGPIYLFLDEVQVVAQWERFVRSLYEQGNYQLFISGSNSELLSSELSSSLSGRFVDFYIAPFDFSEFSQYKGYNLDRKTIKTADFYDMDSDLFQLARQYLTLGGLPEAIGMSKRTRFLYLKNLLKTVIVEDVVKRHNVRQISAFENLYSFLAANVSGRTSVNNLAQELDITPPTISKYIRYLRQAYALFSLPRFSWKLYSIFKATDKNYLIDNGLFQVVAKDVSLDRKIENTVYQLLKRQFPTHKIFFASDERGREVDFLIKTDIKEFIKIQVTHTLTDENESRELGNLHLANKYLTGPNFLLYWQDLRRDKAQPEEITMLPLTKFLVQGLKT